MKPMEIYKKLPRSNCGECPQKACMPFAFALHAGKAELQDCPRLDETRRAELSASVIKTDWREDLIAKLMDEVKAVDLRAAAAGLGAEWREGRIVIRTFRGDVSVSPSGEIESRNRLSPWMKMLVLFYIKNGGVKELSGRWVLHGELRGGLMKEKAFNRECLEPMRDLFDNSFDTTAARLDALGAIHPTDFATDKAWLLHLFPRLPVIILYWPKEEEFDSKVTVRFDSTADTCFDVEQLIFLMEELLQDIENPC